MLPCVLTSWGSHQTLNHRPPTSHWSQTLKPSSSLEPSLTVPGPRAQEARVGRQSTPGGPTEYLSSFMCKVCFHFLQKPNVMKSMRDYPLALWFYITLIDRTYSIPYMLYYSLSNMSSLFLPHSSHTLILILLWGQAAGAPRGGGETPGPATCWLDSLWQLT